MVDPIPSASWAQFVEECLEENGAKFTGECTEWASTNNYGTMPRWDTSLVEDMSSTFTGKDAFNGDISKWNTAQVTEMGCNVCFRICVQPRHWELEHSASDRYECYVLFALLRSTKTLGVGTQRK